MTSGNDNRHQNLPEPPVSIVAATVITTTATTTPTRASLPQHPLSRRGQVCTTVLMRECVRVCVRLPVCRFKSFSDSRDSKRATHAMMQHPRGHLTGSRCHRVSVVQPPRHSPHATSSPGRGEAGASGTVCRAMVMADVTQGGNSKFCPGKLQRLLFLQQPTNTHLHKRTKVTFPARCLLG